MANVKLSFLDPKRDNSIMVIANQFNEIYLGINEDGYDGINEAWIVLDIETAIKFSKELRKQIAIAKSNQEEENERLD